MKRFFLVLALAAAAVAQTRTSGAGLYSGAMASYEEENEGSGWAAFPVNWVNSGLTTGTGFCSPPGGTFDAIKTMPGDYAATFAALMQAKTDQVAANQWWLLKIAHGTTIHGSTYINGTLVTWPSSGAVTKCLVIQSDTHNSDNATVCSLGQGIPGYGGAKRNPNCDATPGSAYNSSAKMWNFVIDSDPMNGNKAMSVPIGPSYIRISDMNLYPAPGSAQSTSVGISGQNVSIGVSVQGDHFILDHSWIHGWDPGDAGQPGAGSGNPAVDQYGACTMWTKSGTADVSGTALTIDAVTYTKSDWFGADFAGPDNGAADGAIYGWPAVTTSGHNGLFLTAYTGQASPPAAYTGTAYGIASHDPTASNSTFTLGAAPGDGKYWYTLVNPRTGYENGCGDDLRAVQLQGDNVALMFSQVNKIHWFGSESHAVSGGSTHGPIRISANWIEAGSGGVFQGGSTADSAGGPAADVEIGPNFIGRNLDWRFLSSAAGKSPKPPFGCGPLDGNSAHDTCSFNWAMKNNVEFKFDDRILLWGDVIDGSWADGQSGYAMVLSPRACSGGATCGIYDPNTGLPLSNVSNLRVENCWIRNTAQVLEISARSLSAAGDGGGVSTGLTGVDFINCAMTNIGDMGQWGSPGPDIAQWNSKGQSYLATMSRSGGIAHAVAQPIKIANYDANVIGIVDNSFVVSSVSRTGNFATVVTTRRHDFPVGGTVTIGTTAGNSGYEGTFSISSAAQSNVTTLCTTDAYGNAVTPGSSFSSQPQPCIRSDGTFSDTFTYANSGADGTLCNSTSACNALGLTALADTMAYKVTDIAVGDGVYVSGCSGGANPGGYLAGSNAFNAALAGTNPTGMDVYYASADAGHDPDNSGTTCAVSNGQGFPQSVSFQNMTIVAQKIMSIGAPGYNSQTHKNKFINNVWFMPTGTNTYFTCGDVATSGDDVFGCWDRNALEFHDQIFIGNRSATPWLPYPPSATQCTLDGCPADVTALGWSPTFPTGSCAYAGDPNNCPLMAAPWSNNFTLSQVRVTGQYAANGADVTAIENAFSATKYTCPQGANCGTGPYPE